VPAKPRLSKEELRALAEMKGQVDVDPRLIAAAELDRQLESETPEIEVLAEMVEEAVITDADPGDEDRPPPSENDLTRQQILDRLFPKALAAAEEVLDDPQSPASARVAAMKVVWDAKVSKADEAKTPDKIVYLAAAYMP